MEGLAWGKKGSAISGIVGGPTAQGAYGVGKSPAVISMKADDLPSAGGADRYDAVG